MYDIIKNNNGRATVAKVSEIIKKIKACGCYKIREGANHEIWYSPVTGQEFPVPRHYGKEFERKKEL